MHTHTQKPLVRHFSFFVAVVFACQFVSVGWAASRKAEIYDPHKVSVAVLSLPSSPKDRPFVEETARAIRADLEKLPSFHLVTDENVQTIVSYHADSIKKGAFSPEAEKYLSLAKTHWFSRQYEEALATVDTAIGALRKQKQKGAFLEDALLTKAMILQETHRAGESADIFKELLSLNPGLTLEGLPLAGRSRQVFGKTKKEILERHSGSLEIKSNPPAAAVYLNGIAKGVTPLTLTGLPEGSYLLNIAASRYQPVSETVAVTPNTTQFIDRKLRWVSGKGGNPLKSLGVPVKTDQILREETRRAASIGRALKVDRVMLVSSERKGGSEILTTRTIDTALEAGYNPVGVSYQEVLKDKTGAIKKLVADIRQQARVKVLNNPQKFLEPDTGNIKVLRRKAPATSKPVFWLIAGLIVGGGIGTAVGLLLNDDNNGGSSGGGDAGGVDIEFE